jgi:voltage-gated potassium channel Kch
VNTSIAIAGSGRLPAAIERQLRSAGVSVTRLPASEYPDDQLQPGHVENVAVLVLAADDDSGNVELALQARRLRPALPLVVRLFDTALASYLTETLPGITVLSMSGVAAPVFADAARKILAARPAAGDSPPRGKISRRRAFKVDRVLAYALLSLFLLVFPSALLFSHALNLRYMDALYFVWTTVMTVGYGDIALKDASDGIKLFGMALMLAGASFIAVLFALLSDWVVSRRLDLLRGRTRVRGGGHILIAGAGNVGLRIAELLAGSGRRIVIIERDTESRNSAALNTAGHHVIIADATQRETLELARMDSAAVILAVTDADAVNLQIALHAREHDVPVVMRVISTELSDHVSARGDWIALSPVAAAAESFAQAARASATREA